MANKNKKLKWPRHAVYMHAPTVAVSKVREGKQMTRLLPILRELYPPNGLPPDSVKTVTVMQAVLKKYKERGWGTVSRETIEKALKRGRYRPR
jgi:hypothetical protein